MKNYKTPMNSPHDNMQQKDLDFMRLALNLAHKGELLGEVPVGALIVDANNEIISVATNLREKNKSVLGHAELIALHRACKKKQSWRLPGCTLYVTLEPCFMCAGALVQARIARVVFGAYDPKGGALGSLANISSLPNLANESRLNHQFKISPGVRAEECSLLLKTFFKKKRLRLNI